MYDTLALCFLAVRALWLKNAAKVPPAVGLKLGLAFSWREFLGARAGKRVHCLFRFLAVPPDWQPETKTISYFNKIRLNTLSGQPMWRRSDTVINKKELFCRASRGGRQRKHYVAHKLTINQSHTSCSLRSVARCGRHATGQQMCSHPLHFISPILLLGLLTYCIAVFAVMSTG